MNSSRRVRVGLALHALSGACLFERDDVTFAMLAVLLAASAAFLADRVLKRVAAVGAGALMGVLMAGASYSLLIDFGHVLVLLALALPACIDAAGTSFRDARTRWLWLRAVLLLLAVVTTLGMWPAPHPSTLVPVLVVSHLLLRLGTAAVERDALSLRALIAMVVATLALLGLAELTEVRFERATFDSLQSGSIATDLKRWAAQTVPRAPFASLALGLAFLAASLRIAPRAGVDGAIAAALVLCLAIDVKLHMGWSGKLLVAVAACLVATSMANRHIALRAFAGATAVAALWVSEHGGAFRELKVVVIASIVFVAIAALVAARPALPRALPVDPTSARLGALLHMAALCLTVLIPPASLAALVPAVVFATKPLARFGSLALVTMAWAAAPLLAESLELRDQAATAFHAWAPWIMLALVEAIRSRGQPVLVGRLGVTVGALLFSIAAGKEGAPMVVCVLPGAVVVQAVLERAVGTLRPFPRVEPLAVVVAVPLLAGLAVFEFVMRWLVSKDGFYPFWDLHPITLFLIDGAPAIVCLWLIAQAGIRRALPFLAPGGAMLAALGVALYAEKRGHEHELAAIAVAMFCAGAVTRPPLARIAGVWCGLVAAMVVTLRGQLPRPDLIAELGYPLWVILWFGALVAALVLSDAMRAAPLLPAPSQRAREPIMQPPV